MLRVHNIRIIDMLRHSRINFRFYSSDITSSASPGTFLFRERFEVPARAISWFPGHMAKGLRQIQERLTDVDILIEVRDARIPLSSINSSFERILKETSQYCPQKGIDSKLTRLIVYNKMDLIPSSAVQLIKKRLAPYTKDDILFTAADQSKNIKAILKLARAKADSSPLKYPFLNVLVVGMPNVGKSSLINALRRVGVNKGKVVQTGGQPGVTRSVGCNIKVWDDPPIYLVDTPGVMIPHIPDPLISLKVALTGGIRDHLADPEVMCDYLLFRLNQLGGSPLYLEKFGGTTPTEDIHEFLKLIARRTGLLGKGGAHDLEGAAQHLLKRFRLGQLGKYVLDDMLESAVEDFFEYLDGSSQLKPGTGASVGQYQLLPSKQAARRAKREARLEKIRLKKLNMPSPKF